MLTLSAETSMIAAVGGVASDGTCEPCAGVLAAQSPAALAIDCGLSGTVALSPSTAEIQLTGVGSLTACTGRP
jgi:hypothetical protein